MTLGVTSPYQFVHLLKSDLFSSLSFCLIFTYIYYLKKFFYPPFSYLWFENLFSQDWSLSNRRIKGINNWRRGSYFLYDKRKILLLQVLQLPIVKCQSKSDFAHFLRIWCEDENPQSKILIMTHTHTHTYIYIYMCVCVCIYICIYIYIYTYIHIYIYIYICVCVCVYIFLMEPFVL